MKYPYRRNSAEDQFISGVEILSDDIRYVCCKAPKSFSRCSTVEADKLTLECPEGRVLSSIGVIGGKFIWPVLGFKRICSFVLPKAKLTKCHYIKGSYFTAYYVFKFYHQVA